MTMRSISRASVAHDRPMGSAAGRPPHGPKGILILGSAIAFGRDVLGFLTECTRQFGDLVAFRIGAWPALLLNNPDDIEYVLVKNHYNFTKNRFFWRHVRAIFGMGLLTAEGEDWQRQRRLIAPALSGKRLTSYGSIMVRHTDELPKCWKVCERRDVQVDM